MKTFEFIENVLASAQELPSDSILSRTLMQNQDLRVILFQFAPGQELSEHTASKPALLHFLSGSAQVTLGEESKTAEPNTFIYMQPHLPHSIVAKTQVSMLLIMLEKGK
ncbi:MAG TPA: cupin domain-containing protein [Anaerolineales bacterium]|jgi:quercetin dioxygenase-like cupin family protein|nr:cupin domain-containing protein [Anaerolineales bacterium]